MLRAVFQHRLRSFDRVSDALNLDVLGGLDLLVATKEVAAIKNHSPPFSSGAYCSTSGLYTFDPGSRGQPSQHLTPLLTTSTILPRATAKKLRRRVRPLGHRAGSSPLGTGVGGDPADRLAVTAIEGDGETLDLAAPHGRIPTHPSCNRNSRGSSPVNRHGIRTPFSG